MRNYICGTVVDGLSGGSYFTEAKLVSWDCESAMDAMLNHTDYSQVKEYCPWIECVEEPNENEDMSLLVAYGSDTVFIVGTNRFAVMKRMVKSYEEGWSQYNDNEDFEWRW